MKHKNKILEIVALIVLLLLLSVWYMSNSMTIHYESETVEPTLPHRQEVWMNVLEWCESRGYHDAINPEDNDGTPSYGGFQFKPTTLDYYAEMYGVPTTTLMNYETQKAVVTQMILHRDEINWNQQFPACVKRFGPPPKD